MKLNNINDLLNSEDGRKKLASSMLLELRKRRDWESIKRRAFPVQQLDVDAIIKNMGRFERIWFNIMGVWWGIKRKIKRRFGWKEY